MVVNINRSIGSLDDSTDRFIDYFFSITIDDSINRTIDRRIDSQ